MARPSTSNPFAQNAAGHGADPAFKNGITRHACGSARQRPERCALGRRLDHVEIQESGRAPPAACPAARHFRVDERVFPGCALLLPCFAAVARTLAGFPVRHASDQCHAGVTRTRSRCRDCRDLRSSGRLVGRHADRRGAGRIQSALGAAGAQRARNGVVRDGRARSRSNRCPRNRNAAPEALCASAGVAQSVASIRRFHPARAGRAGDPAACRCDACGSQPRQPERCRPGAGGGDASIGPEISRRHVMELNETHHLPVPQNVAWEALNDTEILRACIPGCESIEADGENAYAVAMTASVGPVKAKFKGRMNLVDIDAPHTYTIVFEGQGGTAGFGKGQAKVNLEPGDNADSTTLSYTANAQVGGKLAQIGSRLVDGAARKIAGEFFKRFGAQFAGDSDSGTAASADSDQAAAAQTDTESNDAADTDSDAGATKGKRSWTAWIS